MQLEPGRIGRAQAVYLMFIAVFGTASIELPGQIAAVAGRSGWLSMPVAGVISLVFGWLWIWAASLFAEPGLFDLPVMALGRFIGTAINFMLVLWTFSLLTGALYIGTDVVVLNFLPETPKNVVAASLVLPVAMAVHGQLEVVARVGQLVFWGLVLLTASYLPFSASYMDLRRLLPTMAGGSVPILKGAVGSLGFFAEVTMLVALLPVLTRGGKPGRLMGALVALITVAMAVLVVVVVAVFGEGLAARFHQPVFKLSHIVSVGDILERLDAVVIVIWVMGVIAKAAFWYWLTCLGTAKLLKLKDYRPLVWPMSLLVTATTANWAVASQEYDAGLRAWTTWTIFAMGLALPLVLIVAGLIRRLVAGRGQNA